MSSDKPFFVLFFIPLRGKNFVNHVIASAEVHGDIRKEVSVRWKNVPRLLGEGCIRRTEDLQGCSSDNEGRKPDETENAYRAEFP